MSSEYVRNWGSNISEFFSFSAGLDMLAMRVVDCVFYPGLESPAFITECPRSEFHHHLVVEKAGA